MPKYPFSPEILDAMPEELAELMRGLEITLLEEICSRLEIPDDLNEVTVQDIRALRSHGIGLDEIKKAIRDVTGISEAKLNKLLDGVVDRNQRYYTEVIDLVHVTAPAKLIDEADIAAIGRQTLDTYRNLTASMGFLVDNGRVMLAPAKAYQWALDSAVMQMEAGAVGYNQAIANAVRQLADSGLKTVDYESGHIDQADVAVRRAVLTGVNQLNRKYREQSMEYLETDLVETTAHRGARDKGGTPENHKLWQGKVYRWRDKPFTSKGAYPDFVEVCGYGLGEGIGGWNCRHSFYPFVEGVSERTYTDEELANIDPPPFEYEGRTYTMYEATQKQREIERSIRKQKRLASAYKAAGLKEDATSAGIKQKRLEQKYTEFSRAAQLPEQKERLKVFYTDRQSIEQAEGLKEQRAVEGHLQGSPQSRIIKASGGAKDSNGYTTIDKTWRLDFTEENVSREIAAFTKEFSLAEQEHSLVITKGGEAFLLTGTSSTVDPSIIGADKLQDSVGIHNHPVSPNNICDDSFSKDDLIFSAKYKTGIEYLISGTRRNSFEITKNYSEEEIRQAWNNAFYKVREKAFNGEIAIEWEQEEILKILAEELEGFVYHENF